MKAISLFAVMITLCYSSCKEIEETPTLKLRACISWIILMALIQFSEMEPVSKLGWLFGIHHL
jgi:hypothetical protein